MNKPNRDLLVMFKEGTMSPQAIEHEVERLHELLYKVERTENLVVAHELIDLNKYRIINKPLQLKPFFRNRDLKAFEFLSCNN